MQVSRDQPAEIQPGRPEMLVGFVVLVMRLLLYHAVFFAIVHPTYNDPIL